MIRLFSSKKCIVLKGISLCCIIALTLFIGCNRDVKEIREISFEVSEGTELTFDLSPDGETITLDLLGQIWLLPSGGGKARAITNSVLENSEHLYPAFSADGKRIVFWESRPASWGLSSMELTGGDRKIITEMSSSRNDLYNDRFFAPSPSQADIAFIHDGQLMLINEEAGENPEEIKVEGLPRPGMTDPAWSPDGEKLVFVNSSPVYTSHSGGRLWQVGAEGGTPEPLSDESHEIRSPCYSPDGRHMAYFLLNENLSYDIWIHDLQEGEPRILAGHRHITPLRLKWTPDGKDLIYCAEGRLWKISADEGRSREIPFTARISFSQDQLELKTVRFPRPSEKRFARGHMGLEISPDGKKIAAIALGQLWVWEIEEEPTSVTSLPLTAGGLCWSPDNTEVAWSAGVSGTEDLFSTNSLSGKTRRLTGIQGTEVRASWSPDGKYIAFVYRKNHESGDPPRRSYESMRTFQLSDVPVTDLAQTSELQTYRLYGRSLALGQGRHWGRPWSPDSKYLLSENNMQPVLLTPDGEAVNLAESRKFPSMYTAPLWDHQGSVLYVENFMLWRTPFDSITGITSDSVPVSQDPALYPSVAHDGSVLYVSEDGWRLRRTDGQMIPLGWPLSYQASASPEPLLIRNVRIIDGTGAGITLPHDILIRKGRIVKIAPHGQINVKGDISTIEGEERIVIPGLIDAHMHFWDQVLFPQLLYEGITTVREMGTQLAWVKGFQEMVEAGIRQGPRIVIGGFIGGSQIFPWMNDSKPLGNLYGEDGARRALSLARAFDLDFIKMYMPINAYSGAEFIRMAHDMGFPVSSHAGYPMPLVAAGIDSKEHTNFFGIALGPRISGVLQNDIVQLSKEGGIDIIPTVSIVPRFIAAVDGSIIDRTKDSPFMSGLYSYDELYAGYRTPDFEQRLQDEILSCRENVTKLQGNDVHLAAGTDIPAFWTPWALHEELAEYVSAGFSPMEAIQTATSNAATVLRAEKEIGTIEKGKLADIVILDANPLEDISNLEQIWKVIQGGRIVDRNALENWTKQDAEVIVNITR